ncbi:RTA1-domain-containing protein [Coniochaeta sp. PMI_546]|nr:RTA1-domain-containing protein [Coniochaeta sp. PMI_546]
MMNNEASTRNTASEAESTEFDFKLYRYDPSLPAAIVSLVIFFILTVLHAVRMYRGRAFYFTAFTIGGLFEVVGYCGRAWSHFDKFALGGFIMQAILILVAPALFAASIYMILGRLIRALRAEHLSLIPVRWVTRTFVTGDIISFTLQAGGGGIQAGGTLDLYNIGEKVIVAGLFIQIVFFGFFLITAIIFYRKFVGNQTAPAIRNEIPWRRHLWVLFTVSTIILIRSIFRVVEYLQGNHGFLISHEIFLYMFDALLMAIVMGIFLVYYINDLDAVNGFKDQEATSGSDCLMEEFPR